MVAANRDRRWDLGAVRVPFQSPVNGLRRDGWSRMNRIRFRDPQISRISCVAGVR